MKAQKSQSDKALREKEETLERKITLSQSRRKRHKTRNTLMIK